MSRLGDAKTLGGVGSILLLIPGINIVGYILVLIATKYISDELGDPSIFDNMLYAVVAAIVGVAAGIALFFAGVFVGIFTLGVGSLFGIFGGLAIVWIAFVISSLFIKRAFETMANRLNVGAFRTAGTMYFIGALLLIVFVGFIIIVVAYIFQIIAFFTIQETPQAASSQPISGTTSTTQVGVKFCPTCGTQMPTSTLFCPKCGTKQPL